jgi:hypothetical protein
VAIALGRFVFLNNTVNVLLLLLFLTLDEHFLVFIFVFAGCDLGHLLQACASGSDLLCQYCFDVVGGEDPVSIFGFLCGTSPVLRACCRCFPVAPFLVVPDCDRVPSR